MEKNILDREIGKRVRNLRKSHGLSRDVLAEQLGITLSHMGLIERGERGLTIQKCLILGELFCVSSDYILSGRGESSNLKKADLPVSQLTPHEWQLLTEFITAYSLISPEKRNADLIFEGIRFLLAHYTKIKAAQ